MKKVIGAINMTLDGFCDHTAGLPDAEIHQHYTELLDGAGVILYGRKTYQLMEFWQTLLENPSEEKSMNDFAEAIDKIPKIVFSKTLNKVDWKSATLARRDLKEEILELKQSHPRSGETGNRNILVGSRSLIIQLLKLNLIDEFQLCIHPVIEGGGLPLFENIGARTILRLMKTKSFSGGSVILYYEPKNSAKPNYQNSLLVKSNRSSVYKALTEGIPKWWTKDFSGTSTVINDEFTVRFGATFKTMKVLELNPAKKVVWVCIDTLIDIPELKNNTEWTDTKIVWDLRAENKQTIISLTHIGLTPEVSCYEICEKGWELFLESLRKFLETGVGTPFTKKLEQHQEKPSHKERG